MLQFNRQGMKMFVDVVIYVLEDHSGYVERTFGDETATLNPDIWETMLPPASRYHFDDGLGDDHDHQRRRQDRGSHGTADEPSSCPVVR